MARRKAIAHEVRRRERARFGGSAEQQVLAIQAKMEAKLEAAREHEAAALAKQRVELLGTAEERLAFNKQEQQQRRVDHLHRTAARRLGSQGLVRGWTTWHEMWAEETRRMRLLKGATARLSRPLVVSTFKLWHLDMARERRDKLTGGWEQRLKMVQAAGEKLIKDERRTSAERRIHLHSVIHDLEKQIRDIGREPVVVIPPPEPTVIVIHDISARGVPDADAVGGADPYARIICLDHDGAKKESVYTSYKYKTLNPVWEGERLQLKLTPGGIRPPLLRIEIWDKDQQTPDDILAYGEVQLENATSGSHSISLKSADPNDPDVEAFVFSYELKIEAEEVQAVKWNPLGRKDGAMVGAKQTAKVGASSKQAPAPAAAKAGSRRSTSKPA